MTDPLAPPGSAEATGPLAPPGSAAAAGLVGFVGLGNIGAAMCRRLLALGHPVTAYDVSPAALAAVTTPDASAAEAVTAGATSPRPTDAGLAVADMAAAGPGDAGPGDARTTAPGAGDGGTTTTGTGFAGARDDGLAAAASWCAAAAESPGGAAQGAGVVCVVVNTDEQAVEVITGADGVLTGASPGTVVVLHSTVAPSTVERLAAACADAGVELLDAGISGSTDRAMAGDLVTVVGGTVEALARARPTLDAYCSTVIHCGPSGAGMAAKLARNMAQYGIWCALFESMELAADAGVDLGLYADYVRASGLPENHDVMLGRGTVDPVDPAADPDEVARLRWAVDLGHKDLADAFELAERLGRDVPVGRIARARYARAMGLPDDPRH